MSQRERINRQHEADRAKADIELSPAQVVALGERGNQARLNSGCVCAEGCESCDALAEAFVAMREALRQADNALIILDHHASDIESAREVARAALALAEGVKR